MSDSMPEIRETYLQQVRGMNDYGDREETDRVVADAGADFDRMIEAVRAEEREKADTGCPHEACEIDTAGNPTRCADCGDYLDSVPDQEPSDADFNRAAQAFYEASGLNLPHTSKPEVVAGVRAAWAALLAARNEREGN